LAVAGGDDHEVCLWHKLRTQVNQVRSPGGTLWSVALSRDGQSLGFRDQRNATPEHPNQRGSGPWRVFDLERRTWGPTSNFTPVLPVDTLGGWRVEPSRPDARVWYAIGPTGQRLTLDLHPTADWIPLCYTFLRPARTGGPVRLAVGHLFGISVFELRPEEAR